MSSQDRPKFLPAVRRARIERLDIYEISETELQILERGSPDSILLNFAIFLVSIAVSFLVALLTTGCYWNRPAVLHRRSKARSNSCAKELGNAMIILCFFPISFKLAPTSSMPSVCKI